jgi:hypothetical protein
MKLLDDVARFSVQDLARAGHLTGSIVPMHCSDPIVDPISVYDRKRFAVPLSADATMRGCAVVPLQLLELSEHRVACPEGRFHPAAVVVG